MKADHIITALKPFEGWAVELDHLGPQGPQPYTPLSWTRYYPVVATLYLPPSERGVSSHHDIILWTGHIVRTIGEPSGLCLPSRQIQLVVYGDEIKLMKSDTGIALRKGIPIEDWVSRPYWLEGYKHTARGGCNK